MYDARCIANEFIRRANAQDTPLTHMHIQKLVYFAHARLLVLHRQPLIDQAFEAWEYGPVEPVLYQALKHNGSKAVREAIPIGEPPAYSSRETAIFDWCFKQYGQLSGPRLSNLTHARDAPWTRTTRKSTITNEHIQDYHAQSWIPENQKVLKQLAKIPALVEELGESMKQYERGEHYSAASPDEMLRQIDARAATRP